MAFHQTPSGIYVPNSVRATKHPGQDFEKLEAYARNGFVVLRKPNATDTDLEENVLDINEARERLQVFRERLPQIKKDALDNAKTAGELIRPMEGFMNRLSNAIREAEEQGPHQYADMRRARERDSSKSVFFPGNK